MRQPNAVIKKVLITEKGTRLSETENKYLFAVNREANSIEIKNAVQKLFKVNVTKVNTLIRPSKLKRDRRMARMGHTSEEKRAIVTLKEGQKIDLT